MRQGCTVYCPNTVKHIVRMVGMGLEELTAGVKIGGQNTDNLKYANNTIFLAENKDFKQLIVK